MPRWSTSFTLRCAMVVSLAILLLVAVLTPARAFDVTPTVSVLELPRDTAGTTLLVRNPRSVDLPIEFEVFERTILEDGSEEYTPADNLFLVFPPQAVIGPDSSQSLRVQWVGTPPSRSRSFTLFASQMPVEMKAASGPSVQTLFRVGASVHVTPADIAPEPVLLAARAQGNGMQVTIANRGQRFFYMNSLDLDFDGKHVGGVELANIAGRTLVTPGAKRTFVVPGVKGTPGVRLVE
ncbi:P pilus assembly protein, chaperone PapD [Modicisalibacter ilicicola DSM 19980]|uniref:P pilus assembly protein, chaperone PapD n=1 Tax=Modicisalibacter ilicicola DSM 19980 TaxID=1121942 RepID=A0A1M4ZC52_9GAMM|nr:fimbria/pilus periplasmic chaperone [Halomonas ilicicola]SHF15397.1 P pilus assembly protein, chaperone PapD [Halomonas ilicicola DSM 19980]